MTDLVNHPPHYEEQAIKLEPIDFCERLPFCEGNALKYCFRAGHKDGASELQDLKKAQWYLSRCHSESSLRLTAEQEEAFSVPGGFLLRDKGLIGAAAHKCLGFDYADFIAYLGAAVRDRIKELESKNAK